MFRWLKRLVNYICFRKVSRQIDKRELKKLVETQKFKILIIGLANPIRRD